jgi:16S rRNA (guanine527-N7)-methyltransferase
MDLLAVHRARLETFRKAMNLVGPGPVEPHYADAEEALAGLEPAGRWADLGTGAGFPGIVFAARFPGVALDLVDSRRKRCAFLEGVLALADLGDHAPVRVVCGRVEDLPAHAYDGVMARAFAPPDALLAHARRLLVPGGTVVLFLQDDAEPAVAADFVPAGERRYAVDGRRRRAVWLRWTGQPSSG